MNDSFEKKIKIAIVAPSLRVLGGQSIQANCLIGSFADDVEFSVSFIPNDPKLTVFGFLQRIRIVRTIVTSLKFWWILLIRINEFDLVQVFSSGTTSYVISTLPPLIAAKFFSKKVILNYHTGAAEEHLKKWGWFATSTMRRFDKIVVPSQFLVDVFEKFNLKSEAVFNFVDTDTFRFRERKPLQPIFLSNRVFEKHYNVSCILRAFKIIQEESQEARLIVAGAGREESELKKLTNDLELQNVEFIGRVALEDMPKTYDKADVYLNSSVVDNMPLSIIEAHACGLPVVSSNAGGIPYIVKDGETGLLSEINDCKALAENAIRLLKDDELCQKLIYKARQECVKYTWENIQNSWKRLYQKVVSG